MITTELSIHLIVVFIALSLSHSIKLYMTKSFSLDKFDKNFFMNSGAIIVALYLNNIIIKKLDNSLNEFKLTDSNDLVFDESKRKIIKDIIETALIVTIPRVVKGLINGNKIFFDDIYFRNLFLSIAAVSLYNILFEPLINKFLGIKHQYISPTKDIIKKTTILAVSDYMTDLDLEPDFKKSILSTASGILLSEFAKPHVAKLLTK
jgi:hypothetical protein